MLALLDDQANDDAQTTPLNKAVGINIRIQDGSRAAFVAKEVTLGAWELNQGGRPDAVMLTVPLRARYFSKVGEKDVKGVRRRKQPVRAMT